MTSHDITCSQDTLTYHDRLMEHLYSEESEWNMLDVVGKGAEQDTPTNLIIADSVKESCRQELLNVSYVRTWAGQGQGTETRLAGLLGAPIGLGASLLG